MKKENKSRKKKIGMFFAFVISIAIICIGMLAFYQIRYPVKHQNYIAKYSAEYSLDKELVASIINEESSFDASIVSSKGAVGLMQILPSTGEYIASKLGETFYSEKLFDPETNIKYGCYYLNYLRDKFVYEKVYLSAYNAGETTVSLWLANKELSKDGKTLNKIPYTITASYTNKILQGKKHYKGRI